MAVKYGASGLIPAPLVSIVRSNTRNQDGTVAFPVYQITIQGTIVAANPSLDSPGVGHSDDMRGILGGQKFIRDLFSEDGQPLVISGPNGPENEWVFFPKIEAITFQEGIWYNRNEYSISLVANQLWGEDEISEGVTNETESWDVQESQDGTFAISHRVSAVGLSYYTSGSVVDALTNARNWCRDRSYSSNGGYLTRYNNGSGFRFDTLINPISASGNFYNRAVVESPGISENSWRLNETFIHYSGGNVREEWSANLSFEQMDQRKVAATINGNIYGYAEKERDLATRNSRAKTYYYNTVQPNLYTRLSEYIPAGYTLAAVPESRTVAFETTGGVVSYTANFTAISGFLIANAVSEDITIEDNGPLDVFASIPVPGRGNGPIIQNMNTITSPERTVSISAIMMPIASGWTTSALTSLYLQKPNTDAIVAALQPSHGYFYIKTNSESWQPIKRQYSRVVSWTIQNASGVLPNGMPTNSPNNLE